MMDFVLDKKRILIRIFLIIHVINTTLVRFLRMVIEYSPDENIMHLLQKVRINDQDEYQLDLIGIDLYWF